MPINRVAQFIVLAVVVSLAAAACSSGGRARLAGNGSSSSTQTTGSTPTTGSTLPGGPGSATPAIKPAVEPTGASMRLKLETPDGRTRTYRLYVPTAVSTAMGSTSPTSPDATRSAGRPVTRVPLLIALHGGFGSGDQFARTSGFEGLAEANDFVVAFPDGVGGGPRGRLAPTWNGGNCCGPAAKQNVDDVTFVRLLIDQISTRYPIDPKRVFAAGHSNGGILSYRLACELADKIAAIGVQSTSLELSPCTPSEPVSVLHIHGTADRNIPINGGKGSQAVSGVSFWPPLDGVRTLARADGCAASPTTSTDPSNADITIERWTGCATGTDVEFVKVAGAPHNWMGHPAPRKTGNTPYQKLDSSAVIWSFLAAHPKP